MDFNGKYILNSEYILRTDQKRIIISSRMNALSSYCYCIHPVLAIMLSFFKGADTLNETIKKISCGLGVDERKIIQIISPLIDNEKALCISYDNEHFWFPEYLLVKNLSNILRDDIETESFMIPAPYDFKTIRLNIPLKVTLILNTQCITDCIYCYADKITNYTPMPKERVLNLVDEAKNWGITNFDLSGGDIFLYNDWERLLKKIYEKGYNPDISTKFPLTEQQIDKLYESGTRKIQVSLDSIDPKLLEKTLKVPTDYCKLIKKTIVDLDRKGFSITIRSTLTKDTCTIENIQSILNFICNLSHVNQYDCMPAGYSLYKSVKAFNEFKPSIDQVIDTKDFLMKLESNKYHFNIIYDDSQVTDGAECCCAEAFDKRAMCSANTYSFAILPDGKVTICELLYWNEHFVIGDVMKNSLMEVWQSKRAWALWRLDQNLISYDSPCRDCKDFNNCRYQNGVCWKDIIAVYGKKNFFYPDIHCPKAPKPIFPVFYDNSFMSMT